MIKASRLIIVIHFTRAWSPLGPMASYSQQLQTSSIWFFSPLHSCRKRFRYILLSYFPFINLFSPSCFHPRWKMSFTCMNPITHSYIFLFHYYILKWVLLPQCSWAVKKNFFSKDWNMWEMISFCLLPERRWWIRKKWLLIDASRVWVMYI